MSAPLTPGARLSAYVRLMRLDRPIGSLLLLWPTLWALWIAGAGRPDVGVVLVFVLGVVLMRSAGCTINDFADRDFDPHVARTRERPLARGQVAPSEAVALFVVLSLAAFALVLTMNRLTVLLSLVGAALAASYPFMKRYTDLPQVYLGLAFGWAVPMAFAAQTGAVPGIGWLLYLATLLWTVAYDTEYAMVDRADDLRIGVRSTAILFGSADRFAVGALHAAALLVLAVIGAYLRLGPAYYAGLLAAAALAVYQQYLIRAREPAHCFRAFLNNNWFGAAVFAGLAAHYLG
ncbi:MAG: 4-hydroxybenzoate octaprenyltransferase [Gammaproteobacteria bacterium]|nr:4-hydroxybenzoate octaprenyltransferase [Gammaproteobacteria bacterium]